MEKQNNIGLEVLLVVPLQIIAGYIPLLQEYTSKTEQGHSDLTDLPTVMGPYEQLADWILKNANTSIDAKAKSKVSFIQISKKIITDEKWFFFLNFKFNFSLIKGTSYSTKIDCRRSFYDKRTFRQR